MLKEKGIICGDHLQGICVGRRYYVDALKFRLVQYDTFYKGQIQQDSSECLVMLIEVLNRGSVPFCGSNDNNSIGIYLSDFLFSFSY